MGAAAAFVPLAAAALPIAGNLLGFGPKQPKAPRFEASTAAFQAQTPPPTPTLADANVERARRASTQSSIRGSTVRTSPRGLLDDGTTTAGASLLG